MQRLRGKKQLRVRMTPVRSGWQEGYMGGWQLETGTEVDKGVLGAGALSDPDGPCSHTLSIGQLPSSVNESLRNLEEIV